MGISGLLPLLKSIHQPCNLKKFAGQTIGVDAYGWLHRGTASCAVDLALGRSTTKFVEFALSRVRMLIHFGITPYMVFDGDNLPSKALTEKDRRDRRRESKKAGLELLRLSKSSQAHQELQKAVDVTPEMARMLIDELKKARIDYVVAPYEADAQLVYLERQGLISGILSEDSDMLVFGARCLITKLNQYGDCVMIRRDDFTACREVSLVGWSDADFRRMAILSGCDYLPNISKMGLKTAYRQLRKHKTVDRVLQAIQFEGQFKVPPTYSDDFIQAENTFLYQWVYCPNTCRLVNFSEPSTGADVASMPYIGDFMPAEIAKGVATGILHPRSKRPFKLQGANPSTRRSLGMPKSVAICTPDLKKPRSIDSFFRPNRPPLAELDPNCFRPSPSQQILLQQAQSTQPFDASPSMPLPSQGVHVQSRSASQRQAFSQQRISSVNLSASNRIPSDVTVQVSPSAPPSKKQRLCTDISDAFRGDGREELGCSRFFSPHSRSSPSVKSAKKNLKVDIELWSDDSLEEAMADISDPFHAGTRLKNKKVAVFEDTPCLMDSQAGSLSDFREDGGSVAAVTICPAEDCSIGTTLRLPDSIISSQAPRNNLSVPTIYTTQSADRSKSEDESLARFFSRQVESDTKPNLPAYSTCSTQKQNVLPGFKDTDYAVTKLEDIGQDHDSTALAPKKSSPEQSSMARPVVQTGSYEQASPRHFHLQKALGVPCVHGSQDADFGGGLLLPRGSEDLLIPDSEGEDDLQRVNSPRLDLGRFTYGGMIGPS